MITKARTPNVRDIVVLLVRQISVNVRDSRSMMICKLVVDLVFKHLVNCQDIGWLFGADHTLNREAIDNT
jgi:hypothetical protein